MSICVCVTLTLVQGCTLVAHTASPFPSSSPKDEMELITPAVEGTLGVLRACRDSATVRAICVTSSVASVSEGKAQQDKGTYTDKDWSDVEEEIGMYAKSKTLAERAAWAFYEEAKPKWALCTINPTFVVGPCLSPEAGGTSMEIVARLMNGTMPVRL